MDPVTFAAQVLNFVVLVLLLRRFLYGPILRVMAERERRLEETRLRGEQSLAEARALAEEAQAQARRVAEERQVRLAALEAEVAERRHDLLERARREVQARQEEWQEQARRRREDLLRDLRPRLAGAILAVCRRALEDLAGADLEERMAERLAGRLGHAGLDLRGEVTVTSGTPLSEAAKRRLREAMPAARRVEFRPGVDPGIAVSCAGREVAWTFESHLEALEARVGNLLEEGSRAGRPA